MKYTSLILFFWTCLPIFLPAQSELFLIEEAGKYGYINIDGDMVIPPKYANASHFSEGLAAVRLTDKFGFIDSKGHWHIPPIYDYATSFKDGQASVWLGRKGMLISPTGTTLPKKKYAHFRVPDGFKIVKSKDGKFGVNNQNGRMILDTIYSQISWSTDGFFKLYKKRYHEGGVLIEQGVADRQGEIIIPLGKYDQISSLGQGWLYLIKQDLSLYEISGDYWQPIREKKASGILKIEDGLFRPITDVRFSLIEGRYSEGIIAIALRDTTTRRIAQGGKIYRLPYKPSFQGFIDTTGQVFLADTNYSFVSFFEEGLTFVSDRKDKKSYLIDKKGTRLNKIGFNGAALLNPKFPYSRLTGNFFLNGWAIVKTDNGIAKLNKKGDIQDIKELEGMRFGSFLGDRYLQVFPIRKYNEKRTELHNAGIYDVISEKLLPIRYESIHAKLYGNKLFYVEQNGQGAYVDTSGHIVWQEKEVLDVYPYDVDHKISLKPHNKKQVKLYWPYRFLFRKPRLSIGFRKRVFKENNKKYRANNLYLMNTSKDTIELGGFSYGLNLLKFEAKDSNGEWQGINYCKDCDVIFLNAKSLLYPGHQWYYRLPKFKGHVKTEFRIIVPYTIKGKPNVPLELIKTFKGGINPAQFWRSNNY